MLIQRTEMIFFIKPQQSLDASTQWQLLLHATCSCYSERFTWL